MTMSIQSASPPFVGQRCRWGKQNNHATLEPARHGARSIHPISRQTIACLDHNATPCAPAVAAAVAVDQARQTVASYCRDGP